jgi:hypothetical protein
MKNIFEKVAVATALLIGASANAQPVIPATYTESAITSGGILSTAPSYGPTVCTNSASIDYTPFCGGGACGMISNPQLTAVVVDGTPGFSSNLPTLYLNDQTMSGWAAFAIPAPQGCYPDVIVANDLTTPGDFLVGVIANNGGSVTLFTYSIPGATVGIGGGLIATLVNVTPMGNATPNTLPHIDIIGEYSTPLYGLATANKFAATWEFNGIVMGDFGWLGSPTFANPPVVINPNGTSPDVAAVERFNWGSGGFEDWALFSYVDVTNTPNILYYQEWCMSPMLPPSAPIIYDNTKTYYGASAAINNAAIPRIDAIDNFNNNTPGPERSTFCIVTPVVLSVTVEDFEYNDRVGPGPGTDITSGLTALALQKKVNPTVACGPGLGYSIGFYSYSSGGAGDTYNSIAIDQATGLPSSGAAYTMNRLPYSGSVHGISHAASCNNDLPGQQQLFASWINLDDLWYKYSATTTPYAYKNQPTAVPVIAGKEWSVSPNPASEYLVLSAPSTFTVVDGATYQVIDMTGKIILAHSISGASEQIEINKLPSGMYMINIHGQKGANTAIKFVKE